MIHGLLTVGKKIPAARVVFFCVSHPVNRKQTFFSVALYQCILGILRDTR